MIKYLYSLIFLGFFIANSSIMANPLSQDSISKISEIDVLMDHPSLDKKEKKAFQEKFQSFWIEAQNSTTKRRAVLSICKIFRKKRARIVPDFYDYFKTLILFNEKGISEKDYSNWEKGLIHELKKPKVKLKNINSFLKQTSQLLENSLLYKSFSTKWKTRSRDFHYIYNDTLKIVLDTTELVCYSQRDSCTIYNTGGTYYPFEKKWKGEKGKITWTRAGKSPTQEYAEFKSYQLDITKPKIIIDTAQYSNSNLFNGFILGSLIEKVNVVKKPTSATYPKFNSFEQNIVIDSLFKNISYKGGVAIQGAKFIGKGNSEYPASIHLTRNDTLFVEASSDYFSFTKNKIIGKNTEFTLHLDTFRIYHPNLHLKLLIEEQELVLTRDGTGMSQSPYFNNYHNLLMDFGILHWKMGEDIIRFQKMKGASHRLVKFESLNYFTNKHYLKLQGMDHRHPLVLLKGFANYVYSNTFTTKEYAHYIKKPISQARQQVIGLSFQGFVTYNPSTDEITIKDRSANYISAAMGKQDYDVIRFTSKTEKLQDDATLNLNNFNLQINGVNRISVSNTQNITFVPKGGKLLVKQNRDFEFDGLIEAGPMDMYGENFNFSYDNFEVNMELIDSLKAFIPIDDKGEFARINAVFLERIVKNTSASLQIDAPSNKSGIKDLKKYPIFNAYDQTYAYYNDSTIQNGVYKKDKFFITVDPFKVPSINELSQQNIRFKGVFESGGIVPGFRENLILNDDNSIGFAHAIEENGVLVYNKANFTDSLFLDYSGLWGKGTFTEKTTQLTSDKFTFLPELAKGEAESYSLLAQSTPYSHPDVNGQNIWVEWQVNNGDFEIESLDQDSQIKMYQGMASLFGHMNIDDRKMVGAGEMIYAKGSFTSDYFHFTQPKITADTSQFKLLSNNTDGYLFKADSCNADIDLNKQQTDFKSTIDNNFSSFPINNYICQLNSFKWNMTNDQLQFGGEELEKLKRLWEEDRIAFLPNSSYNTFISTHPLQDSLNFKTPYAIYDTTQYTIGAKFVEKLKVADSDIIPEHGNLTIQNNGYLKQLNNCKILTDSLNNYHEITNAIVQVRGLNSYKGSGSYIYIDGQDKEQDVYFKNISVDADGQTIASGSLPDETSFTLSPDFDFRGDVHLSAREKHLRFDGETKIHNKCDQIHSRWLYFDAPIDPENIMIPIDEVGQNKLKMKTYSSLYITNDSSHIYPTFLSTRKFYTDNPILSVDGYLTYNNGRDHYQIASEEKLRNQTLPGELLSYDMDNCNMKGEGLINLGVDLGEVKTTVAGTIDYNSERDRVTINACLGLNFFFSNELLMIMNKEFQSSVKTPSNLNTPHFLKTFPLLLPKVEADKVVKEIKETSTYRILPSSINQKIFFNRVMLKWHTENRCYYSLGDLELGSILNTTHNNIVKGRIEIRKKRQDSRLYLYMELKNGAWFYFEYQNKTMYMRSSVDKINMALELIKEKDRQYKSTKKNINYIYMLAPMSKVKLFKERHQIGVTTY